MLLCNHGIRKCVPSFTTVSLTPDRRSKMMARVPPLTSYMEALTRLTAKVAGIAHFARALRAAGADISTSDGRFQGVFVRSLPSKRSASSSIIAMMMHLSFAAMESTKPFRAASGLASDSLALLAQTSRPSSTSTSRLSTTSTATSPLIYTSQTLYHTFSTHKNGWRRRKEAWPVSDDR